MTTAISARFGIESINLLSTLAKETKKPKSRILEEALRAYYEAEIKKNIVRSYTNISKNSEMIELAETGLSDLLASY